MSVEYKKEIATKCYELALQLRLQRKYHFHPDDIAEKFRYHYGQDLPFHQFGFEDVAKFLESIEYFFRVKPECGWDHRMRIYLLENYKWKYKLPVDPKLTPPVISLELQPPSEAPQVEDLHQGDLPALRRTPIERDPVEQENETPTRRIKPEPIDDEYETPLRCVKTEPIDDYECAGGVRQPAAAVRQPQAASPPPAALRELVVPVPRPVAPVTETVPPVAELIAPVASPASPVPSPVVPVASSSRPVVSQSPEKESQFEIPPPASPDFSETDCSRSFGEGEFVENPPEDVPRNDDDKPLNMPILRDERDLGPIRFPTRADLPPVTRRPRDSLQSMANIVKKFLPSTEPIRPSATQRPSESLIDRLLNCLRILEREKASADGFYTINDVFITYHALYNSKFTDVFRCAFPGRKFSYLENASNGDILVDLYPHGVWKFARKDGRPVKFLKPPTETDQSSLVDRLLNCLRILEREKASADGFYTMNDVYNTYLGLYKNRFAVAFRLAFPGKKFSYLENASNGDILVDLYEHGLWKFARKGALSMEPAKKKPLVKAVDEGDRRTFIDRTIRCLHQLDSGERKDPAGMYSFNAVKATFKDLFDLKFYESFRFAFPGDSLHCLEEASDRKIFVRQLVISGWYFSLEAFAVAVAQQNLRRKLGPMWEFGKNGDRNREILVNRTLACFKGKQEEVSLKLILRNYGDEFGTHFVSDCRTYFEADRWTSHLKREAAGKITLALRGGEWMFQLARGIAAHPSYQSLVASLPSNSDQSTAASPTESNQPVASSTCDPSISAPASRVSATANPSESHQPAASTFTHPRITAPTSQLSSAITIRPLMSIPIAVPASYLPSTSSPNGAVSGSSRFDSRLSPAPPSPPDLMAPRNERMMSDQLVKCLLRTRSYSCDAEALSRIYSHLFSRDLDVDFKTFCSTSSPEILKHILAEKIDLCHEDGRWIYRLRAAFRPGYRSTHLVNSGPPSRDDRMERSRKRSGSPSSLDRTFPKKSRNE